MKRILFLTVLIGLGVAALSVLSLRQEGKPLEEEKIVEIPRGTSTLRLGELLEKQGLLRSPLQAWAWRALHPQAKFQAGEYAFRTENSADAVLQKIARGQVYFQELTIPEGSSIFDIARIVEEAKLMAGAEFLTAARDPQLIRDLAPAAKTLEGYLFPSTYRLPRRVTPQLLCQRMTTQFRQTWKSLHPEDADVHRTVTLASLVEKESAAKEERPLIAGLFTNRLRTGMKLECDPTVIYAALIEDRYRGTIYRSDLENPSPYNSYQHTGLPPGPIANPGAEAIRAALHPAETDAIFFVAQPGGTGHHVFSKSLADHNRAVVAYRRGQQKH